MANAILNFHFDFLTPSLISSTERQKESSEIIRMLIRNYPPREKTPPGESSGPPVEEEVQVSN